MGVEALGLDHGLAEQAEASLVFILGGLLLGRLPGAGGRGKYPDLAVGEDTVYVEQDQFDLFRPGFGHRTGFLASARALDPPAGRRGRRGRTFYENHEIS